MVSLLDNLCSWRAADNTAEQAEQKDTIMVSLPGEVRIHMIMLM